MKPADTTSPEFEAKEGLLTEPFLMPPAEMEARLADLSADQIEIAARMARDYLAKHGDLYRNDPLAIRGVWEFAIEEAKSPSAELKPVQPVPVAHTIEVLSTPAIIDLVIPDTKWRIASLVPDGGVAMLSGNSGSWKTWLLHHAAVALAAGGLFLEAHRCEQGRVLIIQTEETLIEHKRKFTWTLAGSGLSEQEQRALEIRHIIAPVCLSDAESRAELVRLATEFKPDVVLVDSLRMVFTGEENDSGFAATAKHAFGEIQAAHPCSVVVLHHQRKKAREAALNDPGQMIRGSGAIRAMLDSHLTVERQPGGTGIFTHEKSRSGVEIDPFSIRLEAAEGRARFENLGLTTDPAAQVGAAKDIVALLRDARGGTLYRADIVQLLKLIYSVDQIDRALAALLKKRLIEKGERDGRGTPYMLNEGGSS
jgi:hypothetical protein